MSDEHGNNEDNRPEIKVVDKRRVDADGEVRTEKTEEGPKPDAATAGDCGDASEHAPGKVRKIDFPTFIYSLFTQGLFSLGHIPHPETGEKKIDFDGAKEAIGIIDLLEEKTRGNLTADEDAMLQNLAHDLRLRFIQCVKSGQCCGKS